jgi:phage-related protein
MMRPVILHKKAREVIQGFSKPVRKELGEALLKLQLGMRLGLPLSRPMSGVYAGVHELRLKDADGIYRAFYYTKSEKGILLFHAFAKKAQQTPRPEIELGNKRLMEMLSYEKKE